MKARQSGSKRQKPPLFTVGYEKATPQDFFDALRTVHIDLLVDVRAVAASRRPGFSKKQLAAALDENGIAYVHLQKLGTPAEGREAARAGDLEKLWRIYQRHIKTNDAQAALDELIALLGTGKRLCLLCYERDPARCHRSRIADLVRRRTGVAVRDLIPPQF